MKPEVDKEQMIDVAEKIVALLEGSTLDALDCYAIMSKIMVSIAIDIDSKNEFLHRMLYIYEIERYLNPINPEVH